MRHSPTHEAIHDKTTARHRRTDDSTGFKFRLQWPSVTTLKSWGVSKAALAASVLTCLALGAMASGPASAEAPGDQAVAGSMVDRALTERASRSNDRAAESTKGEAT